MVLIATLFPKFDQITHLERIALSVGTSTAIISFIGLGLNFTPWGIRLDPIVIALSIFILVFTAMAYWRRSGLPFWQQYSPPFREILGTLRRESFFPTSTIPEKILSIILVSIIIMTLAIALGVFGVHNSGEDFTEFYILGKDKMAVNYPTNITLGQDYQMYIGIGNHEYRPVNYTVETWFMAIQNEQKSNLVNPTTSDLFYMRSVVLQNNETVILPLNFSVNKLGYNRIEFLLFDNDIPNDSVLGMDRTNRSYRNLNLWISIHA